MEGIQRVDKKNIVLCKKKKDNSLFSPKWENLKFTDTHLVKNLEFLKEMIHAI